MPVPTSQQPLMAVRARSSQQLQSTRNPGADCLFVGKTARTIRRRRASSQQRQSTRNPGADCLFVGKTARTIRRRRASSQQRQSTRNPGADCLFVGKTARTIRRRRDVASSTNRSKEYFIEVFRSQIVIAFLSTCTGNKKRKQGVSTMQNVGNSIPGTSFQDL